MPQPGSNLPDFRAVQLAFAAHIRNPDVHPRPADVEPRRMQIYLDLFFNNIESFLANSFPIAKQILVARGRWQGLVREFVHEHASTSPYFLQISQEFLTFLSEREGDDLPDFLLELCHYEWVELCLSVSEQELPLDDVDEEGDLASGLIVLSPLLWKLSYRYPVHQLGVRFQPEEAPDAPTLLVVNRKRDDSVGFLVLNAVSWRLLELLEKPASFEESVARLAREMPAIDAQILRARGIETLEYLREAEVVLGTRKKQ
jgi:hypothetical protein